MINWIKVNNGYSYADMYPNGMYHIEKTKEGYKVTKTDNFVRVLWSGDCAENPEGLAQWHYDQEQLKEELGDVKMDEIERSLVIKSD